MSKVVPLLIGGTGLAAASYGGYVLFKGKGTGQGEQDGGSPQQIAQTQEGTPQAGNGVSQPSQSQASSTETLLFDSVNSFKTKAKDSPCIKDYFGENFTVSDESATEISSSSKPDDKYFSKEKSDIFKSCLVINGQKTTESGDGKKGTGKFTGLWTFKKGDSGFINFNVAEPSEEDGKLKFTGVFYLVEKGDGDSWSIKHKKEVKEGNNKADKSQLDSHLPKPSANLKDKPQGYGGFFTSGEDLSKMCKDGDNSCPKDTKTSETKKFHGTAEKGDSGSGKPLKEGSEKFDGFNGLYALDADGKLEDQIKEFKGTGTKQASK